jgi:hypothetical protein
VQRFFDLLKLLKGFSEILRLPPRPDLSVALVVLVGEAVDGIHELVELLRELTLPFFSTGLLVKLVLLRLSDQCSLPQFRGANRVDGEALGDENG